jgi:hypothetical protein
MFNINVIFSLLTNQKSGMDMKGRGFLCTEKPKSNTKLQWPN